MGHPPPPPCRGGAESGMLLSLFWGGARMLDKSKPSDKIIGIEELGGQATVLNFWQWAFSDFCDDDLKGWYAEWMVAILLGIRKEYKRNIANTEIGRASC